MKNLLLLEFWTWNFFEVGSYGHHEGANSPWAQAGRDLNKFSGWWWFHPYLGKWSELTSIFQVGWKHRLVFGRGVVPKKQTWIPEGMRELWFLIGMVFLRFFLDHFLFLDPLGFKDKSASFPQASKAKELTSSTHVTWFTCKKKGIYNIYISCFYQNPLDKVFVSSFPCKTPWASRRVSWDELKTRLAEANFKEAPESRSSSCENGLKPSVATTGFPKKGKTWQLVFFWCFSRNFCGKNVSFVGGWCIFVKWNLGRKNGFRLFLYLSSESQQIILVAVSPEFFGNLFMQGDGWWVILLMLQKKSC